MSLVRDILGQEHVAAAVGLARLRALLPHAKGKAAERIGIAFDKGCLDEAWLMMAKRGFEAHVPLGWPDLQALLVVPGAEACRVILVLKDGATLEKPAPADLDAAEAQAFELLVRACICATFRDRMAGLEVKRLKPLKATPATEAAPPARAMPVLRAQRGLP